MDKTETLYFAHSVNARDNFEGWAQFGENERFHEILSLTRINQRDGYCVILGMSITYVNGVATQIHLMEEGEQIEGEDIKDLGLQYRDYPITHILRLDYNKKGTNVFGGQPPKGFEIPIHCGYKFGLYLGYLDGSSDLIPWLTNENIHLFFPFFSNHEVYFLDYADSLKPQIVNPPQSEFDIDYYRGIQTEHPFYAKNPFQFSELVSNDFGSPSGHIGTPVWVQEEYIPVCPKSGKKMKLLIQIEPGYHEFRLGIYDYLNNVDGVLFIFVEPETRMLAYFFQGT